MDENGKWGSVYVLMHPCQGCPTVRFMCGNIYSVAVVRDCPDVACRLARPWFLEGCPARSAQSRVLSSFAFDVTMLHRRCGLL